MNPWFLAVIFLAGFQSHAQLIQVPEMIKQDMFVLSGSTNYFSTNANYSSGGGTYQNIPNGGHYDNVRLDILGRYDYSNQLSIKTGFGFARAASHDAQFDRTNTGLTDIYIGAQYHYLKSPTWNLFPEAWFGYPLFRVGSSTTAPLIDEGAMYLQLGAWLMRRYGSWEPYGYLGFRYQDEGRASLLPFNIGTRYKLAYTWLGLEFEGYQRLTSDSRTSAEKALITTGYNGGSLRYYSTNPSLWELRAYAEGWLSQDLHLKVGAAQTLNGRSTAAGWTVFATLSIDLSSIPHSPENVDRSEYTPSARFRTDEKSQDESYFREKMEVPDGEPLPRQRPKKRKANLDQMIQDTEKSLEP